MSTDNGMDLLASLPKISIYDGLPGQQHNKIKSGGCLSCTDNDEFGGVTSTPSRRSSTDVARQAPMTPSRTTPRAAPFTAYRTAPRMSSFTAYHTAPRMGPRAASPMVSAVHPTAWNARYKHFNVRTCVRGADGDG